METGRGSRHTDPLIPNLGTKSEGFSPPAALPLGKNLGTHRIGGWVGIRAGLVGAEQQQLAPSRKSYPGSSSPQLVAVLSYYGETVMK